MKRFLSSCLLVLAMGYAAFGSDTYVNNGNVFVPSPGTWDLVQLDTTNFVNNGTFFVDTSLFQAAGVAGSAYYETSDTLNYTNNGIMGSTPGFDFEHFPSSVGQAQPLANFVNRNTGFGGGQIYATNGFSGVSSMVRVRATNVVDSGLIQMDNLGMIDIGGNNLDFSRGQLVMQGGFNGNFGIDAVDYGWGLFGDTNLQPWQPDIDLTANQALSSVFRSLVTGFGEQMFLQNAQFYIQNANPTPVNSNVVWRIIYIQDNSPNTVAKNVYFGNAGVGGGEFHVEWAGQYRDSLSGLTRTNYFYLSDDPALRRTTNGFLNFSPPPADFSVAEAATPQIPLPATAPGGFFNPSAAGLVVTNDYSYVSYLPHAVPVDTNSVVGGNPTNMPGRILISGSESVNLANARVAGAAYLNLDSPVNLVSYSNASIAAAYSDVNIGVPSGSLVLSNLLAPQLPVWSGVPGAPSAVPGSPMDGLQAWSGSFFFVDTNGVTNDVRVLLVNSALRPTSPAIQKDIFLHAPISLQINDVFNIFGNFGVDSAALTIETNDNSAFSLVGALNLLSPNIFWSTSFTNLQYLTNFGVITTTNLANFAGNMFSPESDRAAATPYQAFVNHGFISDQGVFIDANYFENSGTIQEALANGMDIRVSGPAYATNGIFTATNGTVSIAANSLFTSNGIISAGQSLTLTMPCYLSDGYVFQNEFGHITNTAGLPYVVTNGNFWTAGGGVRIMQKPATGDLLGTTITNIAFNGLDSINVWPGEDRTGSPAGFAENLALGRMIFNSDANPSHFTFASLTGNNALYVDSIEFKGSATNTDANGNFTSFTIQPGMKIYYAQALMNGFSIAEKLNGKNGGGFIWVSNYAGAFSSTNILYPNNNTYIFNQALAISPDLDSDGDGTVNRDDPTPIPAGLTFDNSNGGPQACAGGNGGGGNGGQNGGNGSNGGGNQTPGTLSFPGNEISSSSLSFVLAQGTYNGLFYDTNGVSPASAGSFTANVTGKGGFSAKLQLGGKTYSFSKAFDAFGHFSGSVTSKGLASLTVDLQLVNNDQIVGQVVGNGWTAQLLADRAVFNSKNPAPAAWVGKDTLLLSTDTNNSSAATGDSFGNVTVSKNGAVQWSGLLPDGSKITQNSAISKTGVWPLYAAPYGGSGSFIGWMQFTNGDPGITGSAVWIVPAGNNALYPGGLTNELDASGSSLTGSGFSGKQVLVLSDASGSTTNSIMILGKNNQSGTVKLTVNPKTGLFTGSVVDAGGNQTLSFQGALLEKSGVGGGFFLNADKSQGGKVYLAPAN